MNTSRAAAPALSALVTAFALFGVSPAAAWGPLGHAVVCEIAVQELSDGARAEVDRLISNDPDYSTYAAACNWPDDPKRRRIQHYVNFPREASSVTTDTCPLASKCLFTGIRKSRRVLSKASSSDRKRLDEMKFLGHWIGDLHQPLHVSFEDDRGGNEIEARGECDGSLHYVWDSCIVEKRLSVLGDAAKIAGELRRKYARLLDEWRGGNEASWADESFRLVRESAVEYCVERPDACWYSNVHRLYRSEVGKRVVVVDETYFAAHTEAVEQRLTQAGIRLAAELERLFSN